MHLSLTIESHPRTRSKAAAQSNDMVMISKGEAGVMFHDFKVNFLDGEETETYSPTFNMQWVDNYSLSDDARDCALRCMRDTLNIIGQQSNGKSGETPKDRITAAIGDKARDPKRAADMVACYFQLTKKMVDLGITSSTRGFNVLEANRQTTLEHWENQMPIVDIRERIVRARGLDSDISASLVSPR